MARGRPKGSKNRVKIEFTPDWELGDKPDPNKSIPWNPELIKEKITKAEASPKVLDICAIIRICSKFNVASLKTSDFFVSFHGPNAPGVGQMSHANGVKSVAAEVELPPEVAALKEDFDRSQLMIDDPVAFEQQQIDADIQRGQYIDHQNNRRP